MGLIFYTMFDFFYDNEFLMKYIYMENRYFGIYDSEESEEQVIQQTQIKAMKAPELPIQNQSC